MHPDAHRPGSVLERVDDQVAERLREPEPVGADDQAAARRHDQQLGAERTREGCPRLGGLRHQRAHVDRLGELGRTPAVRRGVQILQREPGPPQLELHGGHPPGGGRARADAVKPEQRGAERAAQLVRRLGHERHPPVERRAQARRRQERAERGDPAGGREHRRHAAASPTARAVASAAASGTSPSSSR